MESSTEQDTTISPDIAAAARATLPDTPEAARAALEEEDKPKEEEIVNSTASEFDPMVPDLTVGGTLVVGKDDIQLQNKKEPGVECKIRPVRTRQLLAIGRTLTGSTRPVNVYQIVAPIVEARNVEEQQAAAIAAFANLLVTVPHSEREFIDLINGLLRVVDDAWSDASKEDQRDFLEYLDNPDPSDVVHIMAQAAVNERDRMIELGKVLMSFFPTPTAEETPTSEET